MAIFSNYTKMGNVAVVDTVGSNDFYNYKFVKKKFFLAFKPPQRILHFKLNK